MAKTTTTKEIFNNIVETFKQELREGNNPFYTKGQRNFATKNPYGGFNNHHLAHVAKKSDYQFDEWLTYKQAIELKGHVHKGAMGTPVFFYKPAVTVNYLLKGEKQTFWSDKTTLAEALKECETKIKGATNLKGTKTFILKHFIVFNVQQTTLVPLTTEKQSRITPSHVKLATSKNVTFVDNDTPFASYDVEMDVIEGAFTCSDTSLFYQAVVECTKHETRNNRSLDYEEEEIVKAIGTSFLACATGLSYDLKAELVDSLIKKLDENPFKLWKYAKKGNEAFKTIQEWIENLGKAA